MKILISLTYYHPNISGLTVYAKTLAERLAENNKVTILTSKFKRNQSTKEQLNGVIIKRIWAPIKINKGIIMPFFPFITLIEAVKNDIIICHLPQLEAVWLMIWGKLFGKKTIIVHHCEFANTPGLTNKIIKCLTFFPHYVSYLLAEKIVTNTKDYAEHSMFISNFPQKTKYIFPPVILKEREKNIIKQLKSKYKIKKDTRIVGFVGRIGWEKGVDLILNSIPKLKRDFPELKVFFVGPSNEVIGDKTFKKLANLFKKYQKNVVITGKVTEEELVNLYYLFDCLVLPSVNKLESFGIVQPEAMLCGCPVVASNLPGVRVPVQKTGMGKIVPVGDQQKLAKAIIWCIENRKKLSTKQPLAQKLFSINEFYRQWKKILK
jgi:glycosyltransferase involved in cell wall biosynthesis